MSTKLMTWAGNFVGAPAAKGFTVATPIHKHHRDTGVDVDVLVIANAYDAWDQQIEADAKAGKLDMLAELALEDYRMGRTVDL